MPEVDHVVGNAEKMRPRRSPACRRPGCERVQVDDIMSVRETAGHLIDGFGARARAYVQVQNGCDHRCTFCIIPFGRGPSRSVPAGEVVTQIRRLVERGCGEVVLTGVDITAYGGDLPGATTLGALVRQILKLVPELERLRLSSIDQVEADGHLMRAIAEEERLMPHLHLSMQAGDDMILKRMKRRHSRADAIRFCDDVRRAAPRRGVRRRPHRRLPDRDGRDVRQLDERRRRVRPDLPARLSLFSPARERPPRACRRCRVPSSRRGRRACARRAPARCRAFSPASRAATVDVLMERDGVGRTRQFAEIRLPPRSPPVRWSRARVNGHDGTRLSGEVLA